MYSLVPEKGRDFLEKFAVGPWTGRRRVVAEFVADGHGLDSRKVSLAFYSALGSLRVKFFDSGLAAGGVVS